MIFGVPGAGHSIIDYSAGPAATDLAHKQCIPIQYTTIQYVYFAIKRPHPAVHGIRLNKSRTIILSFTRYGTESITTVHTPNYVRTFA